MTGHVKDAILLPGNVIIIYREKTDNVFKPTEKHSFIYRYLRFEQFSSVRIQMSFLYNIYIFESIYAT